MYDLQNYLLTKVLSNDLIEYKLNTHVLIFKINPFQSGKTTISYKIWIKVSRVPLWIQIFKWRDDNWSYDDITSFKGFSFQEGVLINFSATKIYISGT